jgi:DNA-binding MarR family transcriptional regulator
MSTSTNSHSTICLPAHILDAPISPRAREVLMLLASQTSAESPALWICQATIAARLRCSPATVARAIQKLIEAKLIAETGRLHEGRYKFYHVRWSGDEDIKAASKKITKPIRKVVAPKTTNPASKPFEGIQLILPPVEAIDEVRLCSEFPLGKYPQGALRGSEGFDEEQSRKNPPTPFSKGGESTLPPSTITPQTILKDSRIAFYAEIARKRHQESQRLHQSVLQSLR